MYFQNEIKNQPKYETFIKNDGLAENYLIC